MNKMTMSDDAYNEFINFLNSDESKDIFKSYGFTTK